MTSADSAGTPATGIVVRTKVFPLAFLLLLFKTTVTIDGVDHRLPWGENFFPVSPGEHEVRASFRYLLMAKMGENGLKVTVPQGQTVRVQYRSAFVVFMKGRIKVVEN